MEKPVGLDCSPTSGSVGGVSPGTVQLPGMGLNATLQCGGRMTFIIRSLFLSWHVILSFCGVLIKEQKFAHPLLK